MGELLFGERASQKLNEIVHPISELKQLQMELILQDGTRTVWNIYLLGCVSQAAHYPVDLILELSQLDCNIVD